MIPSAIALSHEEQRERLRRSCPEAVPIAEVVGDPCLDQLRASAGFREEYRAAFGVQRGQRLVLLTSTWGRKSLLGAAPDTVRRALAELAREEYRIVAAVHPNAWHGHGGWQMKSWLAPFRRAGLLVPAPDGNDWKAALCAADAFIGDHGSLSLYAAALGIPGLLAAFDSDSVAADSPMEHLGRLLPAVSTYRPLPGQLESARRHQSGDPRLAEVASLVTSAPMEALLRLRRLCYARLGLDEPGHPPVARPVPLPRGPEYDGQDVPGEPAVFVHARLAESTGAEGLPTVTMGRHLAGMQGGTSAQPPDAHLVADIREPEARWAHSADIVVAREGSPQSLLVGLPGCTVLATADAGATDCCLLHHRGGLTYAARWETPAWWSGPAHAASALYACLTRYGPGWRGGEVRVHGGDGLPAALLSLGVVPGDG